MPDVFFVSGMPKSGTTWMTNMLNLVPGIVCAGEGRFFSSGLNDVPSLYDSIEGAIGTWHDHVAHRRMGWIGLDAAIRTVEKSNYLPADVVLKSKLDITRRLVGPAVKKLMLEAAIASALDTVLVGDKTPVFAPEELNNLRNTLPEAKVLFMRRGVKDYLVSLLFHFWRSNRDGRSDRNMAGLGVDDFLRIQDYQDTEGKDGSPFVSDETAERLSTNWARVNQLAVDLKKKQPEKMQIVDYEVLRAKPNETMCGVTAFLKMPASDDVIAQIVADSSIAAVKRGSNSCLKQHIRSGEPGNWRNYLDEHVSQIINSAVAKVEAR